MAARARRTRRELADESTVGKLSQTRNAVSERERNVFSWNVQLLPVQYYLSYSLPFSIGGHTTVSTIYRGAIVVTVV